MFIIVKMKDEILLKLGNKIRYERVKQNLSQEKLAELAEMSMTAISLLETGTSNIKFISLYKIVKALNLDLKDFLDFKL